MKYKSNFKSVIVLFLCLTAAFALSSCKGYSFARLYHDLNVRFNYLINARELFDKALARLAQDHDSNPRDFQPIIIPTAAEAAAIAPDLEEVITKLSFVVKKHSNTSYIAESYMLIAKANFYQLKLTTAIDIFKYIIIKYPDPYLQQEALAYSILANTLLNLPKQADEDIARALALLHDSPRPNAIVYKAYAQVLAQRGEFDKAAQCILQAAALSKDNKEERLKDQLLAAHYYALGHNYTQAAAIYQNIIEREKGPARIIQQAKLNYVHSLISEGSNSEIVRNLIAHYLSQSHAHYKFQSRLYYALGQLYLRDKDYTQAIQAFKDAAAKAGKEDLYEIALANQALGNIYFCDLKDFSAAKIYYEAVSRTGIANLPDYETLQSRLQSLNKLNAALARIKDLQEVLRVAAMPPLARDKFAAEVATRLIKQQQQALQDQQMAALTSPLAMQGRRQAWYFSNISTPEASIAEFKKVWGNRPLADNWRYSTLEVRASPTGALDDVLARDIDIGTINQHDKLQQAILSQIPTTPEQVRTLTNEIVKNYLVIIHTFYADLNQNAQAIQYAEQVLKEYPGSNAEDELYYILAEAYNNLGNSQLARVYEQKLLHNYPTSHFSKIIAARYNEPSIQRANEALAHAYDHDFTLFEARRFDDVIRDYYFNDNHSASDEARAKYYFLCVLAVGNTASPDIFKQELQNLINAFPNTSYAQQCQVLLKLIGENADDIQKRVVALQWRPEQNPAGVFERLYQQELLKRRQEEQRLKAYLTNNYFKKIAPDDKLVVVIVLKDKFDIANIRFNLRMFNKTNRQSSLILKEKLLSNRYQLLSLHNFSNLATARAYYQKLKKNQKFVIELDPANYFFLIMTEHNLGLIHNPTQIEEYKKYYLLTNGLLKTDF